MRARSNRAAADPPAAAGAVENQEPPDDPDALDPDPEGRRRISQIMLDAAEKAERERALADGGTGALAVVEARQAVSRRWLKEHAEEVEQMRAAVQAEIAERNGAPAGDEAADAEGVPSHRPPDGVPSPADPATPAER